LIEINLVDNSWKKSEDSTFNKLAAKLLADSHTTKGRLLLWHNT